MHSRVVAVLAGQEHVIGDFMPTEVIVVSGREIDDFPFQARKTRVGPGSVRFPERLTGVTGSLKKTVAVTLYDTFSRVAVFDVE